MTQQANILIVDDMPDNLHLLVGILKDQGYKVRPAPSGKHALAVTQHETIDLVLLDVMMPKMDGYEVCRRLKARESTREIPIIFLSGLKDAFDKVRAFEIGGVDYITKPFQAQEVLARVKTHLKLRRMQQQLQQQNMQLQQQKDQLQQEIVERKRAEEALREANSTKDTFFSIVAHDLRSPFTALLGFTDLALKAFDTSSHEQIKTHILEIKASAEAVYALLGNLLTWSRIQRGVMEHQPCQLALKALVAKIFTLFHPVAEHKQLVLRQHIPESLCAYADANMFSTVLRNLLSNALKFTPAGGRIDIFARQRESNIEILVKDSGLGIPATHLADLFRIDVKTTARGTNGESGTGLGLPLCKDLIEKHGGTIWVDSAPGRGTTIGMTLPCPQAFLQDKRTPIPEDNREMPVEAEHRLHSHTIDEELLSAALAGLPKNWQNDLQHAAIVLDLFRIEELIAKIRQHDDSLADMLETLTEQYEFHRIQNIFKQIT